MSPHHFTTVREIMFDHVCLFVDSMASKTFTKIGMISSEGFVLFTQEFSYTSRKLRILVSY